MIRLPKLKLLKQGIMIGCLLCAMLLLVNSNVYGTTTHYILTNDESNDTNAHYYLYVDSTLSAGKYECPENSCYINVADSLSVKPYRRLILCEYFLTGDYSSSRAYIENPATLSISRCDSSGAIISGSTTSRTLSSTFDDEYIYINSNEGLLFDFYTGEWTEANPNLSEPGYGNVPICPFEATVVLTIIGDNAAPDTPAVPVVKSGSGNVVESDGKTYTNNDSVVLGWDQVEDNKTIIGSYEIGADLASAYALNIDGTDTDWITDTQFTLSDYSEGTYQIKLKARDYEENTSAYSDTLTLVIDRSVTQPTLSSDPIQIETNSQNQYNVTFNWDAVTDSSGFKYQVALSQSASAPSDYEINDVTTNQYTFSDLDYSTNPYYAYVRVVDTVGNTSAWTQSDAFVLTSPATTITAITANSSLQDSQPYYAVTLTLEDVGADTYVIGRQPDGATDRTAVATLTNAQLTADNFQYTDSSDLVKHGEYTYYVYTKSDLGSVSAESSQTVTIANIPATVAVTDSNGTELGDQIAINSSSYSFDITPKQDSEADQLLFRVKYYPTGNSDQAEYSSDSSALASGPVTVTLTEGSWTCQLEAGEFVDGVELSDSSYARTTSAAIEVIVDLTAPPAASNSFVIKSTDGATTYDTGNSPTNNASVTISDITLNDNSGGTGIMGIYLWNGDSASRPDDAVYKSSDEVGSAIEWTLSDGDGVKTVTMQVIDNAGNQTLVTYQVTLDTTAPAAPAGTGFTHTVSDSLMHFAWQADNTDSDITAFQGQYTLPDGTVTNFNIAAATSDNIATGQYDLSITALEANQPVKLKVAAVDQAGNQSAYSDEYIAYTKATLGMLQDLSSGYDLDLAQHFLKWQLTSGVASSYLLEYGSVSTDGFTVLGSLSPDAGGLITHSGLTAHGTYHYRLVALNGSNDRTEGSTFDRQVPNTAPSAPELQSPLNFGRNGSEFKYTQATDVDGDTLTYHIYLQGTDGNFTELSTTTASGLTEGQTYSWYVVADDGYEGKTQSGTGQFTIDNTAPALTVSSVNRTYTNQSQLTVTASDPLSGIATVSYQKIDGATNEVTETGTITLTGDSGGDLTGNVSLAEGYYHLQFTAYDNSGNSTLVSVNNIKADQTAPELSGAQLDLTPVDGSYYSTGTLPVQLTATDGYSGVNTLRYWILEQADAELGTGQTLSLSSSVQRYSQKISLSGAGGQTYYLKLAVEDAAGNQSPVSGFGPIILDLTAPEVTLSWDGLENYGTGYYLADLTKLTVSSEATDSESGVAATTYAIITVTSNETVAGWDTWENISGTALTDGAGYYLAVKATNQAGLETEKQSVSFIYDSTAPQDLKLTGPSATGFVPGEQVTFTAAATEAESAITKYSLALGTEASGSTELSSLVTGNSDGWIVKESGGTSVQFRFQIPTTATNGTYYPIVKVTNAAGLVNSYVGTAIVIDNTQEKLSVSDQGPYTQFSDRLAGCWEYLGSQAVTGYQYRIIDQDSQTILDWTATTATEITATGLSLTDGKQYFFEAQVSLADGSTLTGTSAGVIVDTSVPQSVSLTTPAYTTSANLNFEWQATDAESGIARVWVALGSDYYQTDVTGGWVEVYGNSARLTSDVNAQLLNLTSGQHYYLTLRVSNGAGLITEKANPGIIIDDTVPPTPVVVDQGAYINPASQPLMASWVWTEIDAESGLASYQWAIIPYGETVASATWTDVGDATSLSVNRTDLIDGTTYYFAVKATNQAGLSSIGSSDGIMMDQTAPIIPTVTLLQSVNLGDAEAVTYITSAADLELAIESYDLSGISSYQYTYDTQTEVEANTDYSTASESQFSVSPTLEDGEITVYKAVCSDGATNISQAGYSAGVILDTGAPQITNVNGTVSGNNLIFDWDVVASDSPVAFYEYALVTEAQVNDTPSSWTKLGLQQSVTIDGTDLEDGNYRLIVRGCSAAGVYSRREGTIDEWGVSPKVTLDREPPVMDESEFSYPSYAADQMTVTVTATDELAGIGGYQYALGSQTDPQAYSDGWVDVAGATGTLEFAVATQAITHGSEVYLMVRAQDQVGLWSTALVSDKIVIDHTVPTTPEVTCSSYTTSLSQVSGIGYQSGDPESGVTHCRLGIVKQTGDEWLITQETPVADFTGVLTGLTLEEGQTYYIVIQTRNGAGEWSAAGYSGAVVADTIVPELTFTQAASTVVLNAPPLAIEYSLTEAANLQFTLTGADGSAQQTTAVGQTGLNYYTFTMSTPQTYQLSVVPTDLAGNIGLSQIQAIRVNNPPLITLPAFITTPGAALQLTATVTDTDGTVVSYQWDPGDGGVTLTEAGPTYRYYQTGTYTVTLIATDNDGGVSTATTTVTVSNTTHGSLQGDETWSGTHYLYDNVTVPSGINLTIESGTVVIADSAVDADSGYALTISGNLTIQGAEQGIVFKSASGQVNGWQGIHITGTAVLEDITVQEAVRGVSVENGASVTLTNCILQNNQVGLHVYNTQFTVTGCSFLNNSVYGIKEDEGGRPVVVDCVFSGNGIDYYHDTLTDISLDELNQLDGNSGNH